MGERAAFQAGGALILRLGVNFGYAFFIVAEDHIGQVPRSREWGYTLGVSPKFGVFLCFPLPPTHYPFTHSDDWRGPQRCGGVQRRVKKSSKIVGALSRLLPLPVFLL